MRDRRRAQVDDRMCDPRCASAPSSRVVRLERVGRVREVDEERDVRAWRTRGAAARPRPGRRRPGTRRRAGRRRRGSCRGSEEVTGTWQRTLRPWTPTPSSSGCSAACSRSSARHPTSTRSRSTRCGSPATRRRTATRSSPTTRREIHEALQRLARRGWTRLASGAGSRAAKYRQLFDEALGLARRRGRRSLRPDAARRRRRPGELNQRTARLHPFTGLGRDPRDARPARGPRAGRATRPPARSEGGAISPPPRAGRRGGGTSLDSGRLDRGDCLNCSAGARDASCRPGGRGRPAA